MGVFFETTVMPLRPPLALAPPEDPPSPVEPPGLFPAPDTPTPIPEGRASTFFAAGVDDFAPVRVDFADTFFDVAFPLEPDARFPPVFFVVALADFFVALAPPVFLTGFFLAVFAVFFVVFFVVLPALFFVAAFFVVVPALPVPDFFTLERVADAFFVVA